MRQTPDVSVWLPRCLEDLGVRTSLFDHEQSGGSGRTAASVDRRFVDAVAGPRFRRKQMPEIRELRASERHFLDEMLREAAYFHDPSKKLEKLAELAPILSSYFDNFGREGEIALVVETAEGLGGAAWTRRFSNEVSSHGYVDDDTPELGIAIKEEWRNRGIGTRLIARIMGELSAAGFSRVSLSVDKRNPAVRLYQRLGFQIHSEGENFYTMVKDLEPPV